MKKRIFRSIILVSVAVCAAFALSAFLILTLVSPPAEITPLAAVLTIAAFFAAVALSAAAALFAARRIMRPLKELDIQTGNTDAGYPELAPLLHRINRQDTLIGLQMNDLRRRQEEFNTITENMSEGLVVIDDKAEILSYNNSALRLLDAQDASYGTSVLKLGKSGTIELAVRTALGGKRCEPLLRERGRVFQVFASPVFSGEKTTGAVLVILDVTEKEERDTMRREFTSNVSHELKTPLTSIYGISEIMMNGIVKSEDITGFASDIHSESGRLITLVNDIIKLSQLDENSIPSDREPVELLSVAKEVRERLRPTALKRGITIEIEGGGARVNGIPAIISEIIYNLCDNAIKYNRENGRVTVFVGYDADSRPLLRVSDTGIGIPEEAQPRIFERFYRVDKSHSKEIGGTGLGLSIVKHAAAYHNAEISLASHLGEGTRIEIRF